MFLNRRLLIASMHEKHLVLSPILEKELGVKCFNSTTLNTYQFGTFTGEIERKHSALETARKKCLAAMEQENFDLAIASEGSFGNHPFLIFVSADEEILVLIDKKNNLEIAVKEISTQTNFSGKKITCQNELLLFAQSVQFPTHRVIMRKNENCNEHVIKGIGNENDLIKHFHYFMDQFNSVFVETDMRAMYNPSRMKVIEATTHKLVLKIKNGCPNCSTPGFDVHEVKRGLPCMQCNFPTNSIKSLIYQCKICSFKSEQKYPEGKALEEPKYCDMCNP